MAEALLKAWKAPALVSVVEIDGAAGRAARQENTRVDDIKAGATVSWTQLDAALPMPIDLKDPVIALAAKASDVEEALNEQVLKVTGLDAPRYQLKIDDKEIVELTKDQLAAGVNLAAYPTPMFRQAQSVHRLTLRHNDLHFQRWRTLQVPLASRGYPNLPKAIEGLDAPGVGHDRRAA